MLHERFAFVECAPATEADVLRCHTPALVEQVRTTRGWIDGDTICTRDDLRRRAARRGRGDRGGAPRGLRARAAARPSRRARRARWASASSTRSRSPRAGRRPSSASSGWRSSTGTSTTATARRTSSATTRRSSSRRCTSGRSTRAPAARTSRARRSSTSRSPPGTGDAGYLEAFDDGRARGAPVRARPAARLGRLRRARRRIRSRTWRLTAAGFTELARRCSRARAARRRGARGRLQPARRCPTSSARRSTGSANPDAAQRS